MSTNLFGLPHTSVFSIQALGVNNTYLGEHFAPILGVVGLLYRIWNNEAVIFLFQSLTLGMGAVLVHRLANAYKLDILWANALSLCFLLYQPLRAANTFDFREDNLFVVLFLGMLLAWKKSNISGSGFVSFFRGSPKKMLPFSQTLTGLALVITSKRRKIKSTLLY